MTLNEAAAIPRRRRVTKTKWSKEQFSVVTRAKECRAAGGHTPSAKVTTEYVGGKRVQMVECLHCTVRYPA